jgi:DNA-binding NarL/FixJ family response regulator
MYDEMAKRAGGSILLADDHALVVETLSAVIESQSDMTVHSAPTLEDALASIVANGSYDVVLLDYNMPGMQGLVGLSRAIELNSGAVALLSGQLQWPVIEQALALGAAGYVPKTLPVRSFINAVRFIMSGEVFLPSGLLRDRQSLEIGGHQLKPIEQSVLRFLGEGRQNKEIARELDISDASVKLHVKSLCTKLGAKNRTQVVIMAQRENLI